MRTFVIADAHGYPAVIQAALDHGGFGLDGDRLVFGGDFLDRGPDPKGCLDLIELYASEVLVGNHDLAVLLDAFIWPQQAESPAYRPLLIDKVLNKDPAHAWKAATSVEGVLITHAGVSARYERVFHEACGGDPAALAEYLNEEFRRAVWERLHEGGGEALRLQDPNGEGGVGIEPEPEAILGEHGPFWFRPPPYFHVPPLAGVRQIAGHSPPIEDLEQEGFYMIDPAVMLVDWGEPLHFRYAIIEEGSVLVEQGMVPVELIRDRE